MELVQTRESVEVNYCKTEENTKLKTTIIQRYEHYSYDSKEEHNKHSESMLQKGFSLSVMNDKKKVKEMCPIHTLYYKLDIQTEDID